MGLFSTKTKIYVSGGISRIRPDDRIINTSGLVALNAIANNEDIGASLTENAISGTVGSYKTFWRRTANTVGLPTGSFSYYYPDKDVLATNIRTDTGNAYPLADDIDTVTLGLIVEDNWVKYNLQEEKDYNLTTNKLTHLGNTYDLVSYVNMTTKFEVTITRTVTLTPLVTETLVIDLVTPLPPEEEWVLDEQDNYALILVPINYWQITYTNAGREYLWIGKESDYPTVYGIETDVDTPIEDAFNSFAPVIPLRNDFQDYTKDHEPIKYAQYKKLLKIIGLGLDELNEGISTDNPDIGNIADSYVTLQSKLVSTHMDELAYNYKFFDLLRDVSGFDSYEPVYDESGVSYRLLSSKQLIVFFSEIYQQTVNWAGIDYEEDVVETLSTDYTCQIVPTGVFEDSTYGKYIIKKRTSPTTCSVITVKRLFIEYFVYYSANQGKAYSTPFNSDANDQLQLTIPVSLVIVKEALKANQLEEFFLRTTYVGVFSRVIVKVRWYEQGWFKGFLVILSAIAIIYCQSCAAALSQVGTTTLAAVGITGATMSFAAYAALVLITGYAVINYSTKLIFRELLKLAGDNESLRNLVKIAYVVAAIYFTKGKGIFNTALAASSAYIETLNADIELMALKLKDLQEEFDKFIKEIEGIPELKDNYKNKTEALFIVNMFQSANERITESQFDSFISSPGYIIGQVRNFVSDALRLPSPAEILIKNDISVTV